MILKIQSKTKKHFPKAILWLFLTGLLLALIITMYQINNNSTNKPNKNSTLRKDFAKCLTSKELIMYGDDNCDHCQSQKKMFGDDFDQINYVNCAFEIDRCREQQISVYPVWQKNDNKYMGVQSFEDLAGISGCTNPN